MNITADECAECGSTLEEVRLGKWQCTKCELDQMMADQYNAGYQAGLSKAQADYYDVWLRQCEQHAKKPLTPFQKFYGEGFEEAFSEREIAIDSWNAALSVASDRLKMYGESSAIELLEILYED